MAACCLTKLGHMDARVQGSTFAGDADCREGESAAGFRGTAVRRTLIIHRCAG